jgi:5-methylcytosine-specific restriction enzyme subunit McrC
MSEGAAGGEPGCGVLCLRELEEQSVELPRADAEWLQRTHGRHIAVIEEEPEANRWLLRAGPVCGLITLPSGRRLQIESRVPVRNVWALLALADQTECLSWPAGAGETLLGLVDGLMEVFAREMERLIERGLAVGYRQTEGVRTSVRGRLDVQRQVRELPGKPDRFACSFSELTRETPENRVLAAALQVVLRAAPARSDLRASAARSLREIGGGGQVRLERSDLAAARVSAATRHYRVPLTLARLLIEGLGAGHRADAGCRVRKVPSLLVVMPQLFERFVCRTLARGLSGGTRVRWTGHSVALDAGSQAMLTPDAVVEGSDGPLCVVDAKYKPQSANRQEPSSSDLYQMLAYCVGYGVRDAVLVYPRPVEVSPVRIKREGFSATIHALGIDLSADALSLKPRGNLLCAQIAELLRAGPGEGPPVPERIPPERELSGGV